MNSISNDKKEETKDANTKIESKQTIATGIMSTKLDKKSESDIIEKIQSQ